MMPYLLRIHLTPVLCLVIFMQTFVVTWKFIDDCFFGQCDDKGMCAIDK